MRKKGIVKWFNCKQGYGFIIPDDGEEDIFLHVSDLKQVGLFSIAQDQDIEFSIGRAPNGKTKAMDIKLIGEFKGSTLL